MEKIKEYALGKIDENASLFTEVSDKIWEYAELSLKEYKSAALYADMLKKLGFETEENICGIKTAFTGTYGSGKPVIGILAEFDALSGLSQVGGLCEQKELVTDGCGHGCGHNMLGAGSLAAAYAVKCWLKKTGKDGTVIFFGCPGEEGGASKAFMARENIWRSLDAALTWHPSDCNEVVTGGCNACIQVLYKFKGKAAHAAGNPAEGRSALDAVELMNVGVQFLREHMKDNARIHYAITDGGGLSPNVVQPHAAVLYMVRSPHVNEAVALAKRVDKIAEGAALMTETAFEKVFIDGTADTISNHTLEKLAYDNFAETGTPKYTQAELDYADKLAAGLSSEACGTGAEYDKAIKEAVEAMQKSAGHSMNSFLCPYYGGDAAFSPGSTDVGDVSWQTPTVQIHVASYPNATPGHSWQIVSCGKTEIGHKAVLCAGKVLAATAIDLLSSPETLASAKAEFEKATAKGYTCPVPAGEEPKAI